MSMNPEHYVRYIFDAVAFVVEVIGVIPDVAQTKVLRDVSNPDGNIRTAVKSCHGAGKTALLAWIVIWFICTRPFPKIPCTAPSEHQLDDLLWPEIYKWLSESKANLIQFFKWEKKSLFLKEQPERWWARPRVAKVTKGGMGMDEAVGLQGFHEDHLLFVGDEASGIPEAVYGTMQGAVSTCGEMKIVVAGNPNLTTGFFYDAFNKDKHLWNRHTISYLTSKRVKREWAIEMIETYGIQHPWVQVRVLGEFPTKADKGLFDFGQLTQCESLSLDRMGIRTLGVDVARYGDSFTVMTLMSGQVVDAVHKMQSMDIAEIAIEAERIAKVEKCDAVVVDADGVGAGVFDLLTRALRDTEIKVIGWRGGNDPSDPNLFLNARSELNWMLADKVKNLEIQLMEDEKLKRQASAYTYDFNGKGKIVVPLKKVIAKAIGESPDELDSLGYAAVPYLYGSLDRIPQEQSMTADSLIL